MGLSLDVVLPEKRKVGSSTLPLTTRSIRQFCLSTCGNAIFGHTWSLPASARSGPLKTGYGRSLVHVGGTAASEAFWRQTTGTALLAVKRRCLACLVMAAQDGRRAHSLQYFVAVLADYLQQEHRQTELA